MGASRSELSTQALSRAWASACPPDQEWANGRPAELRGQAFGQDVCTLNGQAGSSPEALTPWRREHADFEIEMHPLLGGDLI